MIIKIGINHLEWLVFSPENGALLLNFISHIYNNNGDIMMQAMHTFLILF